MPADRQLAVQGTTTGGMVETEPEQSRDRTEQSQISKMTQGQ